MTDLQLRHRIQRFFFALDHFYKNGLSEYWLQEMKHNRELIEAHFVQEDRDAEDKAQLKLKFK